MSSLRFWALRKIVGIIIGAMLLIAAFFLLQTSGDSTRPLSVGTETHFDGYIRSGEKFGIKIGDDTEQAKSNLIRSGFRYDGVHTCLSVVENMTGCDLSGQKVFLFFRSKKIFRDGQVFVQIENDQVVSIAWKFHIIFADF